MSKQPQIYTPVFKVTMTGVRNYRYYCLEHHAAMRGGRTDKSKGEAYLTFVCGCKYTVAMK